MGGRWVGGQVGGRVGGRVLEEPSNLHQAGVPVSSLQFFVEDQMISGEETPEGLGMETGDAIEVMEVA